MKIGFYEEKIEKRSLKCYYHKPLEKVKFMITQVFLLYYKRYTFKFKAEHILSNTHPKQKKLILSDKLLIELGQK